jgi:hypothetical protein
MPTYKKPSSMEGYSGTPLIKKLGIKARHRMHVANAPDGYFDWLYPLPDDLDIYPKLSGQLDFIHLFVRDDKMFRSLFMKAKKCLRPAGMIWISWPKKSSKVATDLDENIIRDFGLSSGLVDVKVCAVNEIWSGLKFVIPLKDRG